MLSARELADDLVGAMTSDFVRLVADWLNQAAKYSDLDVDSAPELTGSAVEDALVAAAAAHARFKTGGQLPQWTSEPQRRTETLWYPGPVALLPNALVHSPLSSIRGLQIKADSLEPV